MLPQPYIEPVRSYFHCWQRQRYWRAQAGQIRPAGQTGSVAPAGTVEIRGLNQASSVVFQQAKIGRQRYLLLTAAGQINYLAWALQQCRRPQSVFCLQLSTCFLTLAWDDTVLLAYVFTDSPPEFLLRNLAQRQGFQPRVYFYSPAAALSVDSQEAVDSQEQISDLGQLLANYFVSPCELVSLATEPGAVAVKRSPAQAENRWQAHVGRSRKVVVSVLVLVVLCIGMSTVWWLTTVLTPVGAGSGTDKVVGTDAVETDAVETEGNVLTAMDSGTRLGVEVFPALFLLPELIKEQDLQAYRIELQQGGDAPKLLVSSSIGLNDSKGDQQRSTPAIEQLSTQASARASEHTAKQKAQQTRLQQFELTTVQAHQRTSVQNFESSHATNPASSHAHTREQERRTNADLQSLLTEWLPNFTLQQQGSDLTVTFHEAWLEDLATFAFLAFTHGFAVTAIDVRGNEGYVSGEIRFWAKVGS